MTTIALVRHGITEWNELGKSQGTSDIPLNVKGKQQALLLADRLSSEDKWNMIVSSNLSRAVETAEIIGFKLNLNISHFEERLREINCGKIEGTTEGDRLISWGSNWRELDLGMESFEDVAKRGIEFIEEVATIHKGKRVIVISHGALIGLTLQYLLPSRFQKTYIDNTSLTILKNIEGHWDCTLYNCTNHLKKP